jgi:hypothetical protein
MRIGRVQSRAFPRRSQCLPSIAYRSLVQDARHEVCRQIVVPYAILGSLQRSLRENSIIFNATSRARASQGFYHRPFTLARIASCNRGFQNTVTVETFSQHQYWVLLSYSQDVVNCLDERQIRLVPEIADKRHSKHPCRIERGHSESLDFPFAMVNAFGSKSWRHWSSVHNEFVAAEDRRQVGVCQQRFNLLLNASRMADVISILDRVKFSSYEI